MKHIFYFLILLGLFSFGRLHAQNVQLIDKKATKKTKALYANLKKLSENSFLIGHQDTDAYGTTWKNQPERSDIKDVVGSHAAVHGWDLGNENEENNLDGVPFASMRNHIINAYRRGGINTISWHLDNPVTGADSWNKQPVVSDIIPGGKHHKLYIAKLDKVADFLNSLEDGGTKIPVIFRPLHEHNGDWFWWGKGNCSEEDYIKLFRFTVDHLKNDRGLHHLIYAFSPDRSRIDLDSADSSYLYGYPGDSYVDILGLDNYMDVGVKWNTKSAEEQNKDFVNSLITLSTLAEKKNKVAALTETGLEGVTNPNWFTEIILYPIRHNSSIRIAYVLLWRNANETHHYVPYSGHPAENNFRIFYNDPSTVFETDLQNIYKEGKPKKKKAVNSTGVESSSIKK